MKNKMGIIHVSDELCRSFPSLHHRVPRLNTACGGMSVRVFLNEISVCIGKLRKSTALLRVLEHHLTHWGPAQNTKHRKKELRWFHCEFYSTHFKNNAILHRELEMKRTRQEIEKNTSNFFKQARKYWHKIDKDIMKT